MAREDWLPKQNPWEPPDYDDQVVYAVRALYEGKANDGQQKLAWDWLMYVTGESDWPFRPGGGEATNVAMGKQFVGKQLRKMLHPSVTPKPKPKQQQGKRQGKSNA